MSLHVSAGAYIPVASASPIHVPPELKQGACRDVIMKSSVIYDGTIAISGPTSANLTAIPYISRIVELAILM